MFCQECGKEIRQNARFCNKCGAEVKQRFGGSTPVPKPEMPPPVNQSAPSEKSSSVEKNVWPSVEHTLIMPTISKPLPSETKSANQERRRTPSEIKAERPTLFEPPAPKPAVAEPAPVSHSTNPDEAPRIEETPRASKPRPATEALRRDSARKPFFTEVMPAVSNRQHSRLVLVVPLLVLILFLVLALAYHAAK
jgi:hypothetical protein